MLKARLVNLRHDAGSVTAEYAVVAMAAVGFAGVLLKVVTSPKVQATLTGLIEKALT